MEETEIKTKFVNGIEVESTKRPWVGIDLDGVLAMYHGWHGINHIGKPIVPVVEKVKEILEKGEVDVKIFTARCVEGEKAIQYVKYWLTKVAGLPELEVTNVKDFNMIELWDDRCVQMIKNEGISFQDKILQIVTDGFEGI